MTVAKVNAFKADFTEPPPETAEPVQPGVIAMLVPSPLENEIPRLS